MKETIITMTRKYMKQLHVKKEYKNETANKENLKNTYKRSS